MAKEGQQSRYELSEVESVHARLEERYADLMPGIGCIGINAMSREDEKDPAVFGISLRIYEEPEEELAGRTERLRVLLDQEGYPDMPIDARFVGEVIPLDHLDAPEA